MNDFDDSMVTTAIGLVRQADLTVTFEHDETDEVWLMARVCNYSGGDPITAARAAEFKEKTGLDHIRRDVWATIKRGQGAAAEKGL
jgi:hypothetical protein